MHHSEPRKLGFPLDSLRVSSVMRGPEEGQWDGEALGGEHTCRMVTLGRKRLRGWGACLDNQRLDLGVG